MMVKKDDKDEKNELEKKLEEIQKEKAEKEVNSEQLTTNSEMDQKIEQLEKALKDQTEIAKRAQYEYYNLKLDFDRYQEQLKENAFMQEVDMLVSVVKKFLPFVENLRKSLATIPDDQKETPLVKGLQMMYDNFLKTLEGLYIKPIVSLGLVPDSFVHEPVSAQAVEDENLKGKIVQELERGFVYEREGYKRVIVTSKVVVGS